MSMDFEDEPSVVTEAIERRDAPRGPIRGMRILLPGQESAPVVEAGDNGFFVATEDLDRFAIGDSFPVTVSLEQRSFDCRVEVVRKEGDRRRGFALKIADMTRAAAKVFEAMRS